ncbi:MAG TPA: SurA N-terminal domain-containing protein [Candidatus Dojkabacteria bacterium]|nr:SurA N-terminal domain-containing protein [Candidatus Dojkabacteria bacterium]
MARVKSHKGKMPVKAAKLVSTDMKASTKRGFKLPKVDFKKINFADLKNKKWFMPVVYVLIFVLAFCLVDFTVQYLNNGYSMAVVNGVRLSKSDYYSRLDKAYGAQASSALIDEELILQEGTKQKITVTQADIDSRVNDIKTSLGGQQQFDDALKTNNITLRDLQRQIKLQIITTKILQPTIKYTEQDVKDFFNQYKSVLYTANTKYEDKKEDVTNQFISQKVDDAKTTWLATLRAQSKIQNNITAQPSYGVFKTTINVLRNAWDSLTKKK